MMLDEIIPDPKRNEVLSLAQRSLTLAGFTLTFLGLLLGFFRKVSETVAGPAWLLTFSFIFFLAISQFTRDSMLQRDYIISYIAHTVSSIFLVVAAIWVFQTVFSSYPPFLILIGALYVLYILWNLWDTYDSIRNISNT